MIEQTIYDIVVVDFIPLIAEFVFIGFCVVTIVVLISYAIFKSFEFLGRANGD